MLIKQEMGHKDFPGRKVKIIPERMPLTIIILHNKGKSVHVTHNTKSI